MISTSVTPSGRSKQRARGRQVDVGDPAVEAVDTGGEDAAHRQGALAVLVALHEQRLADARVQVVGEPLADQHVVETEPRAPATTFSSIPEMADRREGSTPLSDTGVTSVPREARALPTMLSDTARTPGSPRAISSMSRRLADLGAQLRPALYGVRAVGTRRGGQLGRPAHLGFDR
ncbi:MAG: hypothetical protein HC872_03335, partial [Gammaproteobacteria bacterium]|nr:hypothetical protein [Gammaproteobacteria bacterium]